MTGSSKILTVSYGTFSCTLEGFDDPFSTMRTIAEYFRDLAAEDRYFGAEPPTPDVAMLQSLAQTEARSRVAARMGDDGNLSLQRMNDAEPAPEAVSGDVIDSPAFEADEPDNAFSDLGGDGMAPETIAEKLRRIRAVVSKSRDEVAVTDPFTSADDAITEPLPEDADQERDAQTDTGRDERDFAAADLSATLAGIAADSDDDDSTPEDSVDEDELSSALDDALSRVRVLPHRRAPELMTAEQDSADTTSDDSVVSEEAPAEIAVSLVGPVTEASATDAAGEADATDSSEDLLSQAEDDAHADGAASQTDAASKDASSDEISADEDILAAVRDASGPEEHGSSEPDDLSANDDMADVDSVNDAQGSDDVEDAPAALTLTEPVDRPSAPLSEPDVSRLMAEAEHQLEDGEGQRRRRVISQLRAAVVAAKADKAFRDRPPADERDADEQVIYREDLSRVVSRKPDFAKTDDAPASDARDTSPGTDAAPADPAPLMLGRQDRVDRPVSVPQPMDGAGTADEGAGRDQVHPRRIGTDLGPPNDVDAGTFAEFAEEMGAENLMELLEAAAAYSAFVEGEPAFSRPQIMKRVARINPNVELSREAGLRSFGQLLRQGKIRKLQRGQFTIDKNTRFHPGQRIAGE